jgi:hypothetical protein
MRILFRRAEVLAAMLLLRKQNKSANVRRQRVYSIPTKEGRHRQKPPALIVSNLETLIESERTSPFVNSTSFNSG